MPMSTDSRDCFGSVWKWASVLLFFTLSLMCDFTKNVSACVLLQLAHRKRERGKEYLWQSLSWLAEHSVTYLMSIMHLCHLLCILRRETHNIIHNACIMVGHKDPLIQGERSDIQLCRKLTGLNLSLNTSLLEVVDHVNSSISNSH